MEIKPMKNETETAIKLLMEKAAETKVASEAMQFTQAALNLAHVDATLAGTKYLAEKV